MLGQAQVALNVKSIFNKGKNFRAIASC